MKYVALLGIVLVVGLANYYIMRRLYPLVVSILPKLGKKPYYIICSIAVVLTMMGTSRGLLPVPDAVKRIWCLASGRWMGYFIYLLLFFVISEILLLIGKAIKLVPKPVPNKLRVIIGAAVLALAVSITVYGEVHADNIALKVYDMPVENGSLNEDMSVVMVSDIHLGAVNSEKRLPKIVEMINEQNPDVVCIAGDIFDNDFYAIEDADEVMNQLRSIRSKYGVYACLGNHDAGDSLNEMLDFLEKCNITLLLDESVTVGNNISLVGRVDPTPIGDAETFERLPYADILKTLDNSMPVIVMEHNPDNTDEYGSETALVLSGHTHDGQMFPGNIFVRILDGDKAYGESELRDGAKLIVSSGAGTWGMPLRIGTDCEIVRINLCNS